MTKQILTIALSKHLFSRPVATTIAANWSTPAAAPYATSFTQTGFDLDPTSNPTLTLSTVLGNTPWDGIILGWCVRGHVEYTELFERVVALCLETRPSAKLMFSKGPEDLVGTVVRNFVKEESR